MYCTKTLLSKFGATCLICSTYTMRIYIFIAIAIYIAAVQVDSQEDCPLGWQTSRTDRTWPCYLMTTKVKRPWPQAQTFCTQMGGSLLKIESAAEMKWVFDILKRYHGFFPSHSEWWIGLHDNAGQKGLIWIDRSVPDIASLPWSPGEPTQYDHNKACVEYANGTLRHQDCSSGQYFVCKRPKDSPIWCDRRRGWENINSKCYRVTSKLLTYDDARGECQSQNGDLMFVDGENAELVLYTFVESRGANMWIGLRYYNTSTGYVAKWNGPQGTGVTAQAKYWAIHYPDTLVQSTQGMTSCVYGQTGYNIRNPSIWNLANCSRKSFSVCQKAQGSCASGWIRNGQMCFALNTGQTLSWSDAKSYCSRRGAELTHISSQSTQDFINRNLPNFHSRGFGSVWIGLSDGSSSGNSWIWANGERLSASQYSNINSQSAVNRPGIMDCFTIFTDDTNGTWQVAANCSATKNFLCNIPLNKAPKVPTAPPPTGPTTKSPPLTSPHTTAAWSTDCGPFWVKDSATGYCYQISDHTVTWAEAQSTCRGMGANLASINSDHEERFIADRLFGFKSPALWIGMNNLNSLQGYEWTDGTGFGYMNWNAGEPNNKGSNEHCAEFIAFQEKLGKWNDVNCNSRRGYVCKRKSSDFPTTPQPTLPSVPASKIYGCPDNRWKFYGSNCFLFITKKISWNDANTFCQTHNVNLASIADENEQNYVVSQLPVVTGYRDQFWLGFTDSQMQMNFQWVDTTTVGFTNWARGEPNNYQNRPEDCVTIIQQSGQWNDEVCESLQAGFVCKTPRKLVPKGTPQYNYAQGCSMPGTIGFGYKCYKKVTSITAFSGANLNCASKGGQLAVIHNKYEQAFLASQIATHTGYYGYFWIGLSHDTTTGRLQWINHDSVDYTAWSANHTGNANTTCIAMRTTGPDVGLWVDLRCYRNIHYICEYPRAGFSTQFVSTTTLPPPVHCPVGWKEYGGYCYKAYTQKSDWRTWEGARDYCQSMGADLISIHTAGEQYFAYRVMTGSRFWSYNMPSSFWIGLNDLDTEKAYQWSDGTSVNYTTWGRGEPNDASGADDCVEYNKYSSNWNDNNCYIVKPFVCKFRKGAAVKLTPLAVPVLPNSCTGYPGWKEYNNSCYYISPKVGTNSRLSWYDAQKYCLQNGGHLTSIHSEQENNFLITLMTMLVGKDVWVGATDIGLNQFGWSDGTPFDYTKWSGNEPNDASGSEHCGQVKHGNGYWNDNDCSQLYNFICKKPKQGDTTGRAPNTGLIAGGCPSGFTGVANGNKCYKIIGSHSLDKRLNYVSARDACINMSASHTDLASISSHQELASLLTMVNGLVVDNSGVWIGLNDHNKNFRFTWQDGSKVLLTNWAKGQPQRNGYCVEMYTDIRHAGTWNVIPCASIRPYICEAFRDSRIPMTTPASSCSTPGYVMNEQLDCFKVQKTPMNWTAAKISCELDGASLTSVMSIFEQAFIDTITSTINSSVWIGLGDPQLTGTFLWTDTLPVIYTKWDKGEPTYTHGEHCVATHNGFWNDTVCTQQFPSVCKVSMFPHTPPPRLPAGFCKDTSWKAYGAYCYLVVVDQTKWKSYDDAESDCVGRGMQLTSVMGKNEENIILAEIDKDPNPNANVWIGLRKRGQFYRWSDGSTVRYMDWPGSGPLGHECVYMKHVDGKWGDAADCTTRLGYVCKAKKLPPTSPPPTTTTLSPPTTTTVSTTTTTMAASTSAASAGISSSKASVMSSSPSAAGPNSPSPNPVSQPSSTNRRPVSGSTVVYPQIPQPQNSRQNNQRTSLSGGAIAGIIIGVLLGLGLVSIALLVAKKRSGGGLFDFKLLHNQSGFDNAAYDKTNESVKINGSAESSKNGHVNGSVGFQDFDHDSADA